MLLPPTSAPQCHRPASTLQLGCGVRSSCEEAGAQPRAGWEVGTWKGPGRHAPPLYLLWTPQGYFLQAAHPEKSSLLRACSCKLGCFRSS